MDKLYVPEAVPKMTIYTYGTIVKQNQKHPRHAVNLLNVKQDILLLVKRPAEGICAWSLDFGIWISGLLVRYLSDLGSRSSPSYHKSSQNV